MGENRMKIELKPHNVIAYNEAKELLDKYGIAAIVQATGTGKSYVILRIIQDYDNYDKLLIAPTKDIIDQFMENEYWTGHKIKCITYQKLARMYKKGDMDKSIFGDLRLIIIDELHRTGAEKWGNAFKALLEMYKSAKVLGATATPVRYIDDNRDMVEELFHGNYASNINLKDAIGSGILPIPTYIAALYDVREELHSRYERIMRMKSGVEAEELVYDLRGIQIAWERTSGVPQILKKHLISKGVYIGGKIAIFFSDIDRLVNFKKRIREWFSEAFNATSINLYEYHSGIKDYNKSFEEFKSSDTTNAINILMVVNKLNEGVHIDGLKTIIMMRKTESNIIYYQQLGRVLSVGGDNPIIIDLVNNCNDIGVAMSFWKDKAEGANSYRSNLDRHKGVLVHLHDYTTDIMKLLTAIDNRISMDPKLILEEVRNAIKNGQDINKIADRKLFGFVRYMVRMYKNYGRYKSIAAELLELGAVERIAPEDWVKDEISIMHKYFEKYGKDIITKLPTRSWGAILNKADELGLKSPWNWKKEEDDVIEKYYTTKNAKFIGTLLKNRSETSIRRRAAELGVKKNELWTDIELGILMKYYKTEGAKGVISRVKELNDPKLIEKKAATFKAKALELGLKVENWDWSTEEDYLIKINYPIYGGKMLNMLPGRTLQALRKRAGFLGVKVNNN